jgi:hypothetical protein
VPYSEPHNPRFPEPPIYDGPDGEEEAGTCLVCGGPAEPGGPVCLTCADRANQRDAAPCVLCGTDTRWRDGVCARCSNSDLYRGWSEPGAML